MIRLSGKHFRDRAGAVAVEYGLIMALVILGMIGGLVLLAGSTVEMWNDVASEVESAR